MMSTYMTPSTQIPLCNVRLLTYLFVPGDSIIYANIGLSMSRARTELHGFAPRKDELLQSKIRIMSQEIKSGPCYS